MQIDSRSYVLVLVLAGFLASSPPALGEEPGPRQDDSDVVTVEPIDVNTDRGDRDRFSTSDDAVARDAERGLDEPAFVTEIRVDDRAGESVTTAEVLAESMGVHVRSLGGLGGFSSISVRGASSGHTTVLVDGVPLSRISSVSTDLGRIPLDSFSTLELYRGGVPVELGGAALGGALNLVTAVGPSPSGRPFTVSAGFGSFGARHLRARWRDGLTRGDSKAGFQLSLGYSGATGDFSYFNDNGTNLVPEDDGFVDRQNNDYESFDAVARYRIRSGPLTVEVGSRSLFKTQGIPGTASVQSETTSLTTISQLFDVTASRNALWGSPRLYGVASAFALLEWQHYEDLDGEIGVGMQDRRYRSSSGGGAGRLSVDAGESHSLSFGIDGRLDYFTENDSLAMDDSLRGNGWRAGVASSVSDEISIGENDRGEGRWVVSPALRLDWLHTVPIADSNRPVQDDDELATRDDVFLSPRVAYRVRAANELTIKGSVGRYFRAPTVMELYGDRGFVVGNPNLRAETGISGDVGLVWASMEPVTVAGRPVDRVYIEASTFARRPSNVIGFVTTMGSGSRAFNLGDARVYGVETGLSLRVAKTVTLSGNYTLLSTRQESTTPSFDGKPLPQRPRHQLYGRVDVAREVAGRLFAVWGDVSFTSGNFLDQAGLSELPARRFIGAGLKFEPMTGLLVGVEGKNLTDERIETIALDPPPRPDLAQIPRAVADFFGYPLPGRAFYFTMQWTR